MIKTIKFYFIDRDTLEINSFLGERSIEHLGEVWSRDRGGPFYINKHTGELYVGLSFNAIHEMAFENIYSLITAALKRSKFWAYMERRRYKLESNQREIYKQLKNRYLIYK